jgi:hypothetical protein
MPFTFYELHQCGVVSIPPLRIRLRPGPARNAFETSHVISLPLDSAHAIVLPLTVDPRVEVHTVLDVPRWGLDVSFAPLKRDKRAIASLPLLGTRLPCPPRESDQPFPLPLAKPSAAVDTLVHVALLANPAAERPAFLQMFTWY